MQKTGEFPAGKLDVRIQVEKGIIDEIRFYGTYTFHKEVEELQGLLVGTRYEASAIDDTLANVSLADYFGEIPADEIKQLLF